jgi:hypothetical protein
MPEKIKFEVKPLEKKPEEKELEFETWWEGEDGTIEVQEEAPAEVPETVVEAERVETIWREILMQAKEEFPEEIKQIIDKESQGVKLKIREWNKLDGFAQTWFRETFGIKINKKQTVQKPAEKEEKPLVEKETAEGKRQKNLDGLAKLKRKQMEHLHESLRSLDKGELIGKFRNVTRRIVYFNKESQQYFVEEDGTIKNIGVGDIVSDYAWGIKYVPDGEMVESAYRTLAKRVLINETRRDLEEIHNSELIAQKPDRHSATAFFRMLPQLKETFKKGDRKTTEKKINEIGGWAAEVSVREFLSRISLNMNLDFVVSRATVEEDVDYKYDFKIRRVHRTRGVEVESSSDIKSVGFQLKTKLNRSSTNIYTSKYHKAENKIQSSNVDDIILLRVPGQEILKSLKKWLEAGEPSGGPEQFLSPELKKAILKAVTEKLANVPQEVFDKIA